MFPKKIYNSSKIENRAFLAGEDTYWDNYLINFQFMVLIGVSFSSFMNRALKKIEADSDLLEKNNIERLILFLF